MRKGESGEMKGKCVEDKAIQLSLMQTSVSHEEVLPHDVARIFTLIAVYIKACLSYTVYRIQLSVSYVALI